MIVFLCCAQHVYTLAALRDDKFGAALPDIRLMPYEEAFLAEDLPRATYVFADIERLTVWERMVAAELYRALRDRECRCLNDPARVKTRYPLLRALHRAGINPFRIWRLDDAILDGLIDGDAPPAPRSPLARLMPRPRNAAAPRFPVFLRADAGHERPLTDLLETPAALAEAVARLADDGVPPSCVMMIEFCAEPLAPGIWGRFGTMRIGEMVSTDHAVVEDHWIVKFGAVGLATEAMFDLEHCHVGGNVHADALAPAFAIADIEFGRADHAGVGGRQVVYEINTNPMIGPPHAQRLPIRDETLRIARARFAAGLHAIDAGDGAMLHVPCGPRRARRFGVGPDSAMRYRP